MSSQSSTPRPRSSPHPQQSPLPSSKLTARQQDAQARNKDPFELPDDSQWEGGSSWSKYVAYLTLFPYPFPFSILSSSHANAAKQHLVGLRRKTYSI